MTLHILRSVAWTGGLAAALALGQTGAARAQDSLPLAVGQPAPDFVLPVATREGAGKDLLRLSELKGQTVVLAFFYQARTKG